MKKKLLAALLALTLALSFAACGGGGGGSSAQGPSTPVDDTKPSEPEQSQEATIEEQVLFDNQGLKITATKLKTDPFMGPVLYLLIENNTETDLTVQTRNVSVNGYMADPIFSSDVAAGKKVNDTVDFMSSQMELCGIDDIADIELSFHVFTTDDWETVIDTDPIQIKTSLADGFNYQYDDSGEVLYEGNNLRIISKGLSEKGSFLGTNLLLYIENNGQVPITVRDEDTSINGFMVDLLLSEEVLPGKRAVADASIMSSDLEDNNITEITEIETKLSIYNTDTYDDIVETGVLTLTFQ